MLDTYNNRMAAKLGLKSPDQTLGKELLMLMLNSQVGQDRLWFTTCYTLR